MIVRPHGNTQGQATATKAGPLARAITAGPLKFATRAYWKVCGALPARRG
jgi:hypothetical protein